MPRKIPLQKRPRMIAALSDALAADQRGGLERVSGGFADPRPGAEVHQRRLCNELADLGYLWPYLKGQRLSITDTGTRRLAEALAEAGT